jgi:hypothetical protein
MGRLAELLEMLRQDKRGVDDHAVERWENEGGSDELDDRPARAERPALKV